MTQEENEMSAPMLGSMAQRADLARDFPHNTCAASRHAQMVAEAMASGVYGDDLRDAGESILAVVASLWELRTATRWIPVTERLPPDGVLVLAYRKRCEYGFRRDGQWIDTLYGGVLGNGPSHWMPLPAPPASDK